MWDLMEAMLAYMMPYFVCLSAGGISIGTGVSMEDVKCDSACICRVVGL